MTVWMKAVEIAIVGAAGVFVTLVILTVSVQIVSAALRAFARNNSK